MNKIINKLIMLSLITLSINNIYTATQTSFITTLEKAKSIGELQDLIPQAIKSQENMNIFIEKTEEFVNEREDNELDIIKAVINYTLYNPEISKYPVSKKILTELKTRASKPMTPMETLQVLQKMVSNPIKINQLKDNPEKTMNTLVMFISERTDDIKDSLSDLLNAIRVRKIFTNTDDIAKLDELIAIVPLPISLYEKIFTLYLKLKKLTSNEIINTLSNIIEEYKKANKENKDKVKEKLELLLNTIIYSPKFSIQQQQQALTWLNTAIKKEGVKEETEPKKYSDRIEFYYKKSFNELENPNKRTILLSGLAKLTKEKMKAIGNDLQILISTLNFLQHSPSFSETEKIQIKQFITDIKSEVSVSDLISKIYGLLPEAQTNSETRDYIIKLIEKATKSLTEQIKKDKKIPDESEMLKNLITLYILESPIYESKKAEIENFQKDLNDAIQTINEPEQTKVQTTTDIRGRRQIIRR